MDELAPWDIVAVMPVEQVNAALARTPGARISFAKTLPDLAVSGTLGAWAIESGGSMQRLRLRVPLASGSVRWNPDTGQTQSIDGIVLNLEIALKFLTRNQEALLCFDFSKYGETVTFLDATGPAGFDQIKLTILGQTIAEALCEDVEQLTRILATVDLSGSAGNWLAISQKTWCYAETQEKTACLAIFCLTNGRRNSAYQPSVPPGLLGLNRAVLAIGQQAMLGDGLAVGLTSEFRPKSTFTYDARTAKVKLAKPVALPVQQQGGMDFRPAIRSMVFSPGTNVINGHIQMDITTKFIWTITINSDADVTLPFVFDKATGKCAFHTDLSPRVRYDTDVSALIKPFLNFIIRFFIDRNQVLSNEFARYAARELQSFNGPFSIPVRWTGMENAGFASAQFNGGLTFQLANR